jgi:pimeloyl-ACP methyl ester carboxylesterase
MEYIRHPYIRIPDMRTGQIETADVNLYYTIRGAGPMIVILQGGAGNADGSEDLANHLAGHFTVVTYDRRGLSRSAPIRAEGYEIAAHAADVAELIAAFSDEPAFVFGASIGALIGLELVAHHAACVRALVAHEPPVLELLEATSRKEAMRHHSEVIETFRRDGIPAAMKLMVAMSGLDINDREPEVPAQALAVDQKAAAQRAADLRHFLTWDVPAVTRYQPDIAAVAVQASRIVPAVGITSPATVAHRCAIALAGVLGASVVDFPGGHSGYILRPKAFAAKLVEVFQQM